VRLTGIVDGRSESIRKFYSTPEGTKPVTNVNFSLSVGTVVPREVHLQRGAAVLIQCQRVLAWLFAG
jgi:hypothetical protein